VITSPITIRPLTTAIGAEILGVDLREPLDDDTYALIRRTFNERGVVFFRDQHVNPEQCLAFGRRFGPLTKSTIAKQLVDGYADLQLMRKAEGSTVVEGGEWHTDQSFRPLPIMGTVLVAKQIPSTGGDTMFGNMSLAFETLSEGLKQTLRGLRAVHTNEHRAQQIARRAELNAGKPPDQWVLPDEFVHPVVGRHPETGRDVLYVNPTYTVRFAGWTTAESEPLLRVLYAHASKPEFTCRFRWEDGSIAFWDNRQCWHYAVNDYPGGVRAHHRMMVEGPFLQ
jgi:taurine dioxygenase